MRTRSFLIGTLILIVGACSSNSSKAPHAPPLPNKEWLTGKWKNNVEAQFLTGLEFDKDGVVKATFRGLKDPITGRYRWNGDRDVDLEYPKTEDVQKAYEAAAKAYKEELPERIKKNEVDGRARTSLLRLVADKLPDKETLRVGISDPKYLILSRGAGVSQNFEKVDK